MYLIYVCNYVNVYTYSHVVIRIYTFIFKTKDLLPKSINVDMLFPCTLKVVAHCAERCHLLDRLAVSFREVRGAGRFGAFTTTWAHQKSLGLATPM